MRSWRIAAVALLLLLTQLKPGVPQPRLVVVSPAARLSSAAGDGAAYLLEVEVPPLSALSGERVACVYGAAVAHVESSVGEAYVEGSCIILTVRNPGLSPLRVELKVVPHREEKPEPPVAALLAAAAAAAASYLALTESGREKFFGALSVPVCYYVRRREDAKRSAKRVRILEYVRANPGATMRRVSRETGISFGEVQWHISILERLGLVRCVKVGRYSCCFPTGTPIEVWLPSFAERELGIRVDAGSLKRLRSRIEELAERGYIPRGELLSALGAGEPPSR